MKRWTYAGVALAAMGCGGRAAEAPVSQSEWDHARASLAHVRARTPKSAYVERIRVAFREPRTGKVFSGRGAIAVDPHNALRLILLGPAGSTALDVWATPDRWRFVIPPASIHRSGGAEAPPELPIGFFRSWFLRPYDGALLTTNHGELVLRDGDAVLRVSGADAEQGPLRVMRRVGASVEWLEVFDRGKRPPVGERVRYRAMATGLEVEVLVESLSPEPADPAAFLDPDGAGVSL